MLWTCMTKFLVVSNGPGSVSEAVIVRWWWQWQWGSLGEFLAVTTPAQGIVLSKAQFKLC